MSTTAAPLILLVDDDAELGLLVSELFAREGWSTQTHLTGGDGERAIANSAPDVVLLDVMLPDGSGYDVCRRVRAQHPHLGLMMFTARGDPIDRVLGLELGADDYLPKPFEPRELVARVRALLRRSAAGRQDTAVLRFHGLEINQVSRQVVSQSKLIDLTSIEFKLLLALARQPGTVLNRQDLSAAVQVGHYAPLDRTVDVQVARLRKKMRDATPDWNWIDTVRGEGYVFVTRPGQV